MIGDERHPGVAIRRGTTCDEERSSKTDPTNRCRKEAYDKPGDKQADDMIDLWDNYHRATKIREKACAFAQEIA